MVRGECVLKDMKIGLADGSEREVQCLRPGDLIRGMDNRPHCVRDVVKGQENVIYYVTLRTGKTIAGMPSQPILTSDGYKMLSDIAQSIGSGIKIKSNNMWENGITEEEISEIKIKVEANTVYGIMMDDCDEFMVNDTVTLAFGATR